MKKNSNYLFIRLVLKTAYFVLCFFLGVLCFFVFAVVGLFSETIDIMMFRGIVLAIFAFILQLTFLNLIKDAKSFDYKLSVSSLALAFNMCFLVIFPVTIDRSVTIFLLSKIEQSQDGITSEKLELLLSQQYVRHFKAVDRKIHEQIISGNVKIENNKVYLSERGKFFLAFRRHVAAIFNSDKRLLPNKT